MWTFLWKVKGTDHAGFFSCPSETEEEALRLLLPIINHIREMKQYPALTENEIEIALKEEVEIRTIDPNKPITTFITRQESYKWN